MSDPSRGTTERSKTGWLTGWAKVPVLAVSLLALGGSLLIVSEVQGGASVHGPRRASLSARSGAERMAALVQRGNQLNVGSAAVSSPAPGPSFTTGGFTVATPEQGIAAAEAVAQEARTRADEARATSASRRAGATAPAPGAAAGPASGTAAVTQQPSVAGQVCARLLAARAHVTVTINHLIVRYPFLAGQLRSIQARATAQINAQLAEFGCTVSG